MGIFLIVLHKSLGNIEIFDWDENESMMTSALETAYELVNNQEKWNERIRDYASEKLVELANEWLQDNDEADIDEITKEMFVKLMKFNTISAYPEGNFEMFFGDGEMFWGHSIVINGNINGEFKSADIAG